MSTRPVRKLALANCMEQCREEVPLYQWVSLMIAWLKQRHWTISLIRQNLFKYLSRWVVLYKVDFWIFISEIATCVVTMEINQELWGVSWTHRKFDHVTLDANKKQEQQPNCLSGILCKEAINMCKILINSHVFIKWK